MSQKWLQALLMALIAGSVFSAGAETCLARWHGHNRYPRGNSPTYPNATTPHGGFSSSNGYYSGRSRIGDPIPVKPATPK